MKYFIIAYMALLLVAISSYAAEHDEYDAEYINLGEMTIRADYHEFTLDHHLENETIVYEDTTEKTILNDNPMLYLSEVLNHMDGVSSIDSSGFGMGSGIGSIINVRGGGDKSGARVFLNGVPLNQLVDHSVLLKAIPISDIEQISIPKGMEQIHEHPVFHDAIVIQTRPIQGKKKLSVGQTLGNYGQQRRHITAQGTQGAIGVGVTIEEEHINGYRNHSHYDGISASLTVEWKGDSTDTLRMYALTHRDETGAPGALTEQQVAEDRRQTGDISGTFWNDYHHVSLDYERHITEDLTYNASVYRSWRTNDSDFGWGYHEISGITSGGSMELSREYHISDRVSHHITVGGYLRHDVASTGQRHTPHSHSEVDHYAIYMKNSVVIDKVWQIDVSNQFEQARYHEALQWPSFEGNLEFEGYTPSFGIHYQMSDHVRWHASYSEFLKMPAIFDIDAVFPTYTDNVAIRPQTHRRYDVGVEVNGENWHAQVTGFMTYSPNEILYDPFSFQNTNMPTRRGGVDFNAHYVMNDVVEWVGRASYSDAVFDGGDFDGYFVPMTPRQKYNIGCVIRPWKYISFSLNWLFVQDQYRANDMYNRFSRQNYDVLNAKLRYQRNNFSVFVLANNVLNERYSAFQSSSGMQLGSGEYPMPEVNFSVGVEYVF